MRRFWLLASMALVALSVACRLDMLLKSKELPHPLLAVAPLEVRDSARAGSHDVRTQDVTITNDGGGSFTWSASDHSSWIHLDPREGDVPGTLTISLDPTNLAAGVYQGDVTVNAKDAAAADSQSTTISVTFLVQRPGLNVSPSTIEHSTNVNSNATWTENIQVSNSGTGQLTWTATKDRSWLSLNTTSGSGDGTVAVTINSSGLDGGVYHGQVDITSPGATGSPAHVAVTLTVFAPGLAVNPGSINDTVQSGATTPQSHTLHVTNSGTGAITWTATKSQPWVTLSKTSGGVPEDVVVTVDPTGQQPGVQRDTIVFTAPEAVNGPVRVPVELVVTQPGLVVTPPSITATATSTDKKKQQFTLSISNSGDGSIGWFAGADQPWISLNTLGGLTPSTLTVTLDPDGLGAGVHNGTVTVTSPGAANSPFTVPVQFTITQQSCNQLAIDPDVVRDGTLDGNDCEAPHRPGSLANLYTFTANAGDTISMRMTASFDAYLIFTDAAGNVLAQNDECPGETGTACIMQVPITTTGRYFIEATSTAPGATGQLTITVVRERAPTPPQQLGQFRANGTTSIRVGETIPETEIVVKGRVTDPNSGDQVRLEIEVEPLTNSFTAVPTNVSDYVSVGTSTSVHATGLTSGAGYHWQARTCDVTGRCSAWLQFGNNAETDADFTVAPPPGGSPKQP